MNVKRKYGMNIMRKRMEAGITQVQLADICGVSAPYMSMLEHGVKCPSLALAECIAAALGCTVNDFLQENN